MMNQILSGIHSKDFLWFCGCKKLHTKLWLYGVIFLRYKVRQTVKQNTQSGNGTSCELTDLESEISIFDPK